MSAAAIGHVEWTEFARVDRIPAPGEVGHATPLLETAAGGGAVAAVQLARLGTGASFFTALGDDALGHRALEQLEGQGLRVHVAWRGQPTRRALTLVDERGERTIVTLGQRLAPSGADPLPWAELEGLDCAYFTAGDADALRLARAARVLVASPRSRGALGAGVRVDALVYGAGDPDERAEVERHRGVADLLVATEGPAGGRYEGRAEGVYAAAPRPGPVADTYGCGDSFAAGVTFGLGRGLDVAAALELGARCGAACITGRGPYERQLSG